MSRTCALAWLRTCTLMSVRMNSPVLPRDSAPPCGSTSSFKPVRRGTFSVVMKRYSSCFGFGPPACTTPSAACCNCVPSLDSSTPAFSTFHAVKPAPACFTRSASHGANGFSAALRAAASRGVRSSTNRWASARERSVSGDL